MIPCGGAVPGTIRFLCVSDLMICFAVAFALKTWEMTMEKSVFRLNLSSYFRFPCIGFSCLFCGTKH